MVDGIDDPVEYDLSDYDSAKDYIDGDKDEGKGYAKNVVADKENFAGHVAAALSTIRTKISVYGSFWAVFPPILAAFASSSSQ